MSRTSRFRFTVRKLAATAAVIAVVPLIAVAPASAAPRCTSEYISKFVVSNTDVDGNSTKDISPDFTISITPTGDARWATEKLQLRKATVSMWHTVQGCVPGLYHGLADSIWQQLECHVMFGVASKQTGPTFDLESWHSPLSNPNPKTYYDTQCLNTVTKGWKGKGMLIPGALDLNYGNIA